MIILHRPQLPNAITCNTWKPNTTERRGKHRQTVPELSLSRAEQTIYALGSRAPTPPPPLYPGPSQPVLLHRSGEPHHSRDGGTVCKEKRATSYFVWYRARNDDITANKRRQTYHISVEHTALHRRGGANHNDHRPHPTGGGGDKARNDDITTNKRQQPYHTSVDHTAPHRRGGPTKKTTGPTPQGGGGGDEAKQDQTGKATSDRQGGIPWGGGGGGGVWQPCIIYGHAAPPSPPSMVYGAGCPPSCGMECGFPLPSVGWLWGFWGFGSSLSF